MSGRQQPWICGSPLLPAQRGGASFIGEVGDVPPTTIKDKLLLCVFGINRKNMMQIINNTNTNRMVDLHHVFNPDSAICWPLDPMIATGLC
jgi:hypothetical protein